MTRIRFAHPTGAPFATHAAAALFSRQLLETVYTCYVFRENPRSLWRTILPASIRSRVEQQLLRRAWLDAELPVRQFPQREYLRMALVHSGLNRAIGVSYRSLVDWVYQGLDQQLAQSIRKHPPEAVYAYEDGAAQSFLEAKRLGVKCIYDLPIVHYQTAAKIQLEEQERYPELAPALFASDVPEWKRERKSKELDTADHIVVASSVTRKSLESIGVGSEKIIQVPYGVDLERFSVGRPAQGSPFRVLFAGRVGPRKGVHYLLEAWKTLSLPDAELLLVGVNEFPQRWWREHGDIPGVHLIPSVSQVELAAYYRSAHVLAFPSLVEGFGMVILESLACGTPVITTDRTAGPDIIRSNESGWIVPTNSSEALAVQIEDLYRNQDELLDRRSEARRCAEQHSWLQFRQTFARAIERVLEN